MTVALLHPEDLLERDANGELTGAERARLDAHLAQCKTCRFERQVRLDFLAEEESLDADFDVQRLLSEVLAPGAERQLARSSDARAPRARRWTLFPARAASSSPGPFLASVSERRGRCP